MPNPAYGSGQSKRERSQRDGSDNFGGHGGGGGPGGTGAHGGVSHGHQPVRARGDGVGPPMGGRGHRGTVDGEAEVLSGGRERQVAGGQAGGRVEATTGGEGPELHKLELYQQQQQQQYIQEEQEQEIVQVYQHYCALTSALRLQQPPKHIMAPRHHFVCIFRFFYFVDSNNPRFRRNFSLTPISYDYCLKKGDQWPH